MDHRQVIERKQKKVAQWVRDWVADQTNHEMFRDDPPAVFSAYLQEKARARRLGQRASKLHTWHLVRYMYGALNEHLYDFDEFALAAHYARAATECEAAFADADKGGAILIRNATLYLSLHLLAGWKDESMRLGRLLVHGLDTSLLDLCQTDRHRKGELFRSFWFVLHLYAEWAGVSIDISKYSYPEDMNPYAKVLSDWRTTDLAKVQSFITAMAEYHVREARSTSHDESAEFDTEDQMIFPHEILMYLRLREWGGLENPTTFEHPLMSQPLAKLPEPTPLPIPVTPLLDEVIEKFKCEYPSSFA